MPIFLFFVSAGILFEGAFSLWKKEDDQKFEKNQISKNLSSRKLAKAWFL